jgi:intracellular multiplication protein IcmP
MAGASQQPQNTDNSLGMLWGILLAFAVIGLFWLFCHDWIATWILKLRLIEARLISCVFPSAQVWVTQLKSFPPHNLRFSDLTVVSMTIGRYLRFPVSLILLSFALCIYLSRATLRFKRYYDMRTLVELEKQNWAQITPIVALDLVNTSIDEGPWAMALTPFQFAQKNNLLRLERVVPPTSAAVMIVTDRYLQAKLKREIARRVFAVQLGAHWQGPESLSMPTKALFTIFAARAARDRAAADQLLAQIAQSAVGSFEKKPTERDPGLNFFGVETLLRKYQDHPLVAQVTQQHAYILGVMASMLVLARKDGVLASAEFLWLKPCDRVLWFMLNCIGRQTAYAEVAGPFSHWIAECAVGRKLSVPLIDAAVDALEGALREVRLSDEADKE